jgi:hypothetical protein
MLCQWLRTHLSTSRCNTITDQTTENEDITRINEIIQSKLNLDINITNATRMGRFTREKERPIRVTMTRLEDKKMILSRAVRLRELDDEDAYARVYIRPDLTKLQLKSFKKLIQRTPEEEVRISRQTLQNHQRQNHRR